MSQPEQHPSANRGGFLKALLKDTAANTMAIGAAAMVPLVAMVGGGIDASRYYMAQSRLQAACDAGALAGRRAMETTNFTSSQTENEDDPSPQDISNTFFDQNYPDGTFGLQGLQRSFSSDEEGVVTGVASGDMPTTLMGMFGYSDLGLSVTCSADVNIANTDIVFVLDVTGSMQCNADPSVPCSQIHPNPAIPSSYEVKSDSKLADLQSAAKDFYDVVAAATSPLAQVRYGFVPYNSQVNVGKLLYAKNPAYMATAGEYESREPIFDWDWEEVSLEVGDDYTNREVEDEWFFTSASGYVSRNTCINAVPNFTQPTIEEFVVNGSFSTNGSNAQSVVEGNIRTTTGTDGSILLRSAVAGYQWNSSNSFCRVGYDVTDVRADVDFILIEEGERTFEEYRYGTRSFTLTGIYGDGEMTVDTGFEGGDATVTWDGCIEEVQTDEQQTDFTTVASTAYDLDINHVPTSDNATRWKPAVPGLIYYRYQDGYSFSYENNSRWVQSEMYTNSDKFSAEDHGIQMYYTCPTEAQRLKQMDKTEFSDYVDGLRAWGFTYLDAGMIWGGRFISPEGIFADENTSSSNGAAISRHIVFMTDGSQVSRRAAYNLYGIEWWDRRIASDGVEDTIKANHEARLLAACRAARNENISVWVVAFGTQLTQLLRDCATPGRAFKADNKEELSARFKEIAEKIAELRLTA